MDDLKRWWKYLTCCMWSKNWYLNYGYKECLRCGTIYER